MSHPSQHELSTVFQAYQDQRSPRVRRISLLSTFITRVQACENATYKFLAKTCFPLASDSMVGAIFSDSVKKGVKLDYVPLGSQLRGSVPWDDASRDLRPSNKSTKVVLVVGALVLFWAVSRLQF